jgi:hypothetical protein
MTRILISSVPLAFGCLTSQIILSGWSECNTISFIIR